MATPTGVDDDDLASITGEWMRDGPTPADPDAPIEQRFLLQLRDRPDDLGMRMVFADWLEERGQPNKAQVVRLLADPPAENTPGMRELRAASAWIDADWLAIVSRAPIEKCDAESGVPFKYKCPRSWDALASTDQPSVRHCGGCDRSVYFCASLVEVRRHGNEGNCVAFSPMLVRGAALVEYDETEEQALWMGDIAEDHEE